MSYCVHAAEVEVRLPVDLKPGDVAKFKTKAQLNGLYQMQIALPPKASERTVGPTRLAKYKENLAWKLKYLENPDPPAGAGGTIRGDAYEVRPTKLPYAIVSWI